VVKFDPKTRTVISTFSLPGCKFPTGLAVDYTHQLVMSICQNGLLFFQDSTTGKVRKTFTIGMESDGLIFDPNTNMLFVPTASDSMLNILKIGNARDIRLEQKVYIGGQSRSGAVDLSTGTVYIPTRTVIEPVGKLSLQILPTVKAGTFHVAVVKP
jgi:DNA-binding beta-propeller fold protein YncE